MAAPLEQQWTAEQIEQLKALYEEGLRTVLIAERIGRTRAAVNTKLLRLGIRPKMERQKSGVEAGLGSAIAARQKRSREPYFPPLRAVPDYFRALTLDELPANGCRFVHGDGPFLFCGQPQQPGSSYCAGCHPIVWVKREPRFRSNKPFPISRFA